MKLPKRYDLVMTGKSLDLLQAAMKASGYKELPCNVASRHDGNYSVWGTSHVTARIMFECLTQKIEILN